MTNKIMKWAGYSAAIVAFLGAQFWGVPYYISVKVKEEVKTISDSAQTPTEITELTTRMAGVETGIIRVDGTSIRVEGKVDKLTELFLEDLQRRSEQN